MDNLNKVLLNNDLSDEENIDAFLELADLIRKLLEQKEYEKIKYVIKFIIGKNYHDALLWTVSIMQEIFEKDDKCLKDFFCELGSKIQQFDQFINCLGIELKPLKTDIEYERDKNGEIDSFYNILTYKTKFKNIFLISSEKFDTKDNDSIQYKIIFSDEKEFEKKNNDEYER